MDDKMLEAGARVAFRAASDDVWREVDELRGKLRIIISHASGGALSEPGDIDRSINDICVEISRHKNEVWQQAQESARREMRSLDPEWIAMREAIKDIANERNRQIESEGWSPEHDDEHTPRRGRQGRRGPLAEAAQCYIAGCTGVHNLKWPWDIRWWKPTTYRRDLVKAAALLVAEIERIDRAALQQDQSK